MPRLSNAQDQARRQLNDLAARGLSAPDLATRIARVLETAVGWDGFRLFGLDHQTMLVNSLLAASENDAQARLEWLREVYLALPTPYAELPALARNGAQKSAEKLVMPKSGTPRASNSSTMACTPGTGSLIVSPNRSPQAEIRCA